VDKVLKEEGVYSDLKRGEASPRNLTMFSIKIFIDLYLNTQFYLAVRLQCQPRKFKITIYNLKYILSFLTFYISVLVSMVTFWTAPVRLCCLGNLLKGISSTKEIRTDVSNLLILSQSQ
jgi:hypothetical protein